MKRKPLASMLAATGLVFYSLLASADGVSSQPQDAVFSREYRWFNEGLDAGKQSVHRFADGQLKSSFYLHWNNREFTLNNSMLIASDGGLLRQSLTGTSAFGAVVDEAYHLEQGVGYWRSAADQGSADLDGPAFYVAARSGANQSLAALARLALRQPDHTVNLLPKGRARIQRVTSEWVERGAGKGKGEVTLYAIGGLGFSPEYLWLDADGELFFYVFWGMSMAPQGVDYEAHEQLKRVQRRFEKQYFADLAEELTEQLTTPLLIENVDVVDVAHGSLLADQYVVLEGGRVLSVSSRAPAERPGRVLDGEGKTLVPGLWDMHAHTTFYDYYGGIMNIAAGVTTVRDLGSEPEPLLETVARFDSGALVGPRTLKAGFIDKRSPYAASGAVDTLDAAKRQVRWFADKGYQQIKLYSSIDPAWVPELTDLAHSLGMRVGGHIPAFMTATDAVLAGFDEIQHINMLFLNFLVTPDDDTRTRLRFSLYGDRAGTVDLASDDVEAFLAMIRQRGTVVDPTIAIFEGILTHTAGSRNPTYATVMDHFPITEMRSLSSPGFKITQDNETSWAASYEQSLRMLELLYERGITIVPGSDGLPGFTLHRELEIYVESGIPPAAVLRMATLGAAAVMGLDDRQGSIAPGKVADLVLLDGNPLRDISVLRTPVAVIKGELLYRPGQLLEAVGVEPFTGIPAR